MKLSIIILNKDCVNEIEALIHSIIEHTKKLKNNYEIIVINNEPSDADKIDLLVRDFSLKIAISTYTKGRNLYFVNGVNLGIQHAKGEYTLFINSIAVVKDNSIEKMCNFLDENQDYGAVAGKIHYANKKKCVQRGHNLLPLWLLILQRLEKIYWLHYSKLRIFFKANKINRLIEKYGLRPDAYQSRDLNFLINAFAMFRSSFINQFPPELFLYGSEEYTAVKLVEAGKKGRYLAEATLYRDTWSQITHKTLSTVKQQSIVLWDAYYNSQYIYKNKFYAFLVPLAWGVKNVKIKNIPKILANFKELKKEIAEIQSLF